MIYAIAGVAPTASISAGARSAAISCVLSVADLFSFESPDWLASPYRKRSFAQSAITK